MNINRAEIKRYARTRMREARPSVFLVALILFALTWVFELLSFKLMFPGDSLMEIAQNYMTVSESAAMQQIDMQTYMREYSELSAAAAPSGLGQLLDIAISIVSLMLTVGFSFFCLNVSRGAKAAAGNLLDTFGIFFKVLGLSIVTGIFITLWSLLLVVPGIIASYRYRFAMYILLDDPGKSVMQCIRESKEMTQGWKWELFVLDLSFIGWVLLTMIPFVSIYTTPYIELSRATYYCRISGRTEPLDYTFADSGTEE